MLSIPVRQPSCLAQIFKGTLTLQQGVLLTLLEWPHISRRMPLQKYLPWTEAEVRGEVGAELTVDLACLPSLIFRMPWVPPRTNNSVDLSRVMYPLRSKRIFPRLSNKMFNASARNEMVAAGLLTEPTLPRIMLTPSIRLSQFTRRWMTWSQLMNPIVTRIVTIIRSLSLEKKIKPSLRPPVMVAADHILQRQCPDDWYGQADHDFILCKICQTC